MRRLFLLLLAWASFAAPARADDVSAAARGVVRVVTIAVVDGQVVGFGHGSGFAVAPNRIVTNAHVVELAQRYPDNVVIGVVPSEGARSFRARVVTYDGRRDLALIEVSGAPLPVQTLYTGPAGEGDRVTALGYPGNVDLATAQSAADYIRPTSPVRSEGGVSGARLMSGVQVLLHTANIARGNSGGPLLDRCGRVIGVNSAVTRGEEGDASFGFAIAYSEVTAFLAEAGQPYRSVGTPCTSMEERLRADSEAGARSTAEADAARRETAERSAARYQARLEQAREQQQRKRENALALAAVLLVAGAQVLGFAATSLAQRKRADPRMVAAGAALIVAAAMVFAGRPTGNPKASVVENFGAEPSAFSATPAVPLPAPPRPGAALGKLVCTFQPDRSRVTVSSTAEVPIDWGEAGCVSGRTQYLPHGVHWSRTLVPGGEQTVSVLDFDPTTRTYSASRYFLSEAQMDQARTVRGSIGESSCTADPSQLAQRSSREAAIRAVLPPLPNEKLVYSCAAVNR